MAQMGRKATRVLVIDDEAKFCRLVAEFLQHRNYEVAVASTSTQALQQLELLSPDVVLLDIVMPGLSGLELLKLVRSRLSPPEDRTDPSPDPLRRPPAFAAQCRSPGLSCVLALNESSRRTLMPFVCGELLRRLL